MSSDDVCQSSDVIRGPGSPSSELLNGPAKLCIPCQDAHQTVLCDAQDLYWDSDHQRPNCIKLKYGSTQRAKLPDDEWPHLPRLTQSKAVCGFCDLLREALQSEIFSDACEHLIKGFSISTRQKKVRLEISYQSATSLFSRPAPCLKTYIFFIVRVTISGHPTVAMHFETVAVPGN